MIIVSIHTLQENAPHDLRFDDYELASTVSWETLKEVPYRPTPGAELNLLPTGVFDGSITASPKFLQSPLA
jgi:hypothetical protein